VNKRTTHIEKDFTVSDVAIGKKLRMFRSSCGLSQGDLAEKTGISFQQIQKYEKGINRVSASRLFEFAQIFNVAIQDFFENVFEENKSKKLKLSEKENSSNLKPINIQSKETADLLREYYKISDVEKRKSILEFIKKMAKENN
jgi:transcriptional regulator with XRE-family HTH domain